MMNKGEKYVEAESLVEEDKFDVRPAKSISTHMIVATMLAIFSSASILYPPTMAVFKEQWDPLEQHCIVVMCFVVQTVALVSSLGVVYIQLFPVDVDEADGGQTKHLICRKCSRYGHQILALAIKATTAGTLFRILLRWGLLTFFIVAFGAHDYNPGRVKPLECKRNVRLEQAPVVSDVGISKAHDYNPGRVKPLECKRNVRLEQAPVVSDVGISKAASCREVRITHMYARVCVTRRLEYKCNVRLEQAPVVSDVGTSK
ncbi:hypothetical protein CRG98_028627 [Punica granatum]|uniref:Uncharacterized protein n=1 Tax=Punica granatum TaxID=22663 RepID=A0A2I0J509_PUNGR|nr:hypothetical protein CRG98_028627 [Punica granatum]